MDSDPPMDCARVQRTLVKSPPELWAELSDADSLTRHLRELGDVRITHAEPEREVRWAAGSIAGTAVLEPSGWGTRVTLTATHPAQPQPAAHAPSTEAVPQPEQEAVPQPEHEAVPQPEHEAVPQPGHEAVPQPEHAAAAAAAPRRGLFARLLARVRRSEATRSEAAAQTVAHRASPAAGEAGGRQAPAPSADHAGRPAASSREGSSREGGSRESPFKSIEALQERFAAERPAPPEAQSTASAPSPSAPAAPQREQDSAAAVGSPSREPSPARAPARATSEISGISAELRAAEEAGLCDVEAVLTRVLDRLGAAHHRPFSRA